MSDSNTNEKSCSSCGATHLCRPSKVKWRRILWQHQPYDDNYTDESFLSSMRTNENVQEHRFLLIIPETSQITQQISVVAIFLTVFMHTLSRYLSEEFLMTIDVVFIFVGYWTRVCLDLSRFSKFQIFKDTLVSSAKRSFVLLMCLLGITPVLKTLTQSYSDDTIWALSLFCLSVHVVFHDYKTQDISATITSFQETLSLNAAIFGSVLLASRLHSSFLVFTFILFAFELFAGFPMITRSLRSYSVKLNICLTLLMFIFTFLILYFSMDSGILVTVYAGTVIFITILCPYWLEWIQRYKNEIRGPWDYDAENELLGDNPFGSSS
uniref:Phosphatidylinositol N-acetylglucosaminyltransferase subunit C n=1 Tax=Hirondellea gigas TaxID=1518452 RepID=A0A6A7G916_9CRUS